MLFQNKLPSRVFDIAVVVIWSLALTLLTYIANGEKIGIDDADIFFTYASNLADGKGLIYSPGIPKVEGYTSTLWMLLSFLVFKSGLSENGVWILSLVLFALSTLIAFRILEMSLPRNRWIQAKILYLVIISFSFGYSSWMLLTLMDTTLWGFLLMAVMYLLISPLNHIKNLALGSLVFFLLPLSRPESIVLIPLIFISITIINRKWLTKSLGIYFIVFAMSAILLTIFRVSYFGFPFPNTYYAKVSDSLYFNFMSGSFYVTRFLQSSLFALVALCVSLTYISWLLYKKYTLTLFENYQSTKPSSNKNITFLALFIPLYFLVTIFSGGDHFGLFRIMQPIWPFIVLINTVLLFRFKNNLTQVSNSLLVYFTVLFLLFSELMSSALGTSWTSTAIQGRSPIAHEFEIAEGGRLLGNKLNDIFEEFQFAPTVGTITAGGIARTYKGTIYDLMGLNNSEMAHGSKDREGFRNHAIFDKEIFLSWSVDVLLVPPDSWGMDVALKGISSDDQFANKYQYGCLKKTNHKGSEVCAYFRDEMMDKIVEDSTLTFVLAG